MNLKPLHPNFRAPTRSTEQAGAFDLYMPEAGSTRNQDFVGLGFAGAVPEGHVAMLLPRSGTGAKYTLELSNTCGVIDSDYRGEWKAKLRTKNDAPFYWEAGDRLLQMLVVPVATPEFTLTEDLDATARGDGGFGSTGK